MKSKLAAVLLVVVMVFVLAGCQEQPEPEQPVDETEQEATNLAEDYRAELNGTNLELDKLEIILGEGSKETRSLVIAYKTQADDREAFDEEILSLIRPAAGEKYGLADIMIIATDQKGAILRGVSIEGDDVRLWAFNELEKDEFVDRWTVTGF